MGKRQLVQNLVETATAFAKTALTPRLNSIVPRLALITILTGATLIFAPAIIARASGRPPRDGGLRDGGLRDEPCVGAGAHRQKPIHGENGADQGEARHY